MKVVILAGGFGTRLSEYTKSIPKPMIDINGKPMIYYILKLNSNKAKILLKWRCVLTFNETMKMVAEWYKNFYFSDKLSENFTILQIEKYQKLLKERKRNK